jgi:hypothetical protein
VRHSPSCDRRRRLFALFGHAPGLWLCYREAVPASFRGPNALAFLLVVVAVVFAARTSYLAAAVAYVVGHLAWGAYLAWKLPAAEARTSRCDAGCTAG